LYDTFTQEIEGINYFALVLEFIDSGYFDIDVEQVLMSISKGLVPGMTQERFVNLPQPEMEEILLELSEKGQINIKSESSFWVVIEQDDNVRTSAKDMLYYMMMLLEGLSNIHSKGIAHNDIKPDNILVTEKNENGLRVAKYADFGLSCTDETQPELSGTKGIFIEKLLELPTSPFNRKYMEEFEVETLKNMAIDLDLVGESNRVSKNTLLTKLLQVSNPKIDERITEFSTYTLNQITHDLGLFKPDEYPFLKCGRQGSPKFISPEYFFPEEFDITLEIAQKDDVWALGLIFRFVVMGMRYFPFLLLNALPEGAKLEDFMQGIEESVEIQMIEGKKIIRTKEEAYEPIYYISGNDKWDKIIMEVIELMSIPSAYERPTAAQLLKFIQENL